MASSWKQCLYDLSRSNLPEPFFQRAKVIVHALQVSPDERQPCLDSIICEIEEGILLTCAGYSALLAFLHKRLGHVTEFSAENIIATVVEHAKERQEDKDEQVRVASCACFIAILSALSAVSTDSAETCLHAYQNYYPKLFAPRVQLHCQASLALSLVIIAGSHLVRTVSVAQDLLVRPSSTSGGDRSNPNYFLFLLAAFGDKTVELSGPYTGPFALPILSTNDIKARKVPMDLLRQMEAILVSDSSFWIYSRHQDLSTQQQGKNSRKGRNKKAQDSGDRVTENMQLHPVWKHLFAFYATLYKMHSEDGMAVALGIQTHIVNALRTPIKDYSQDMVHVLVSIFSTTAGVPEYEVLLPRVLCAGNFFRGYVIPNGNKPVCADLLRHISSWCYEDISRGRKFAASLELDPPTIYSILDMSFGKLVLKQAPEHVVSELMKYMGSQMQRCMSAANVLENIDPFIVNFATVVKIHSTTLETFATDIAALFLKFFSLFYYQIRDSGPIKHPVYTETTYASLCKHRQKFLMALEPLAASDTLVHLVVAVAPSMSSSFKGTVETMTENTAAKANYPILLQTMSKASEHFSKLNSTVSDQAAIFAHHYGAIAIAAFCLLLIGIEDEQVLSQSTTVQNILMAANRAEQKFDKNPDMATLDSIQVPLLKLNNHFHCTAPNFSRVASVAIMERLAGDLTDLAFNTMLSAAVIAPKGAQGAQESEDSDSEFDGNSDQEQNDVDSASSRPAAEAKSSSEEVSSVNSEERRYEKLLVESFKAHRLAQKESVHVFMRASRTLYPLAVAMDTTPDRPANWDALEVLYALVSNPLAATLDEYGFQHPTVKKTPANKQYINLMVFRAAELIGSYTRNKIARTELSASDLFVCNEVEPKKYEIEFRWKSFTDILISAINNPKQTAQKQAEEILGFAILLMNTVKEEKFIDLAEAVHAQYGAPIQKVVEQCMQLCEKTTEDIVSQTIKRMVRNRDICTTSHIMKHFIAARCYFAISIIKEQFANDGFVSLFVAEKFILLICDALSDWCNSIRLKRIEGKAEAKDMISNLLKSMLEWLALKNNEAERSQQLAKLKFAANRIKKIATMCEGIFNVDEDLKRLKDTRQKIVASRDEMRVKAVKH